MPYNLKSRLAQQKWRDNNREAFRKYQRDYYKNNKTKLTRMKLQRYRKLKEDGDAFVKSVVRAVKSGKQDTLSLLVDNGLLCDDIVAAIKDRLCAKDNIYFGVILQGTFDSFV